MDYLAQCQKHSTCFVSIYQTDLEKPTTTISDCITLLLKTFQWIFTTLSIKSTFLNVASKALIIWPLPPCPATSLAAPASGSHLSDRVPWPGAYTHTDTHTRTHTHTHAPLPPLISMWHLHLLLLAPHLTCISAATSLESRGTWRTTVPRATQSQTRLKRLSMHVRYPNSNVWYLDSLLKAHLSIPAWYGPFFKSSCNVSSSGKSSFHLGSPESFT